MEMHQLRYFVAVARTGTFSRAAGECRVAQPPLSQQIQKLESEVGDLLFERTLGHTDVFQGGKGVKPRGIHFFDNLIFLLLEGFLLSACP